MPPAGFSIKITQEQMTKAATLFPPDFGTEGYLVLEKSQLSCWFPRGNSPIEFKVETRGKPPTSEQRQ
jgi:hypothetical protein